MNRLENRKGGRKSRWREGNWGLWKRTVGRKEEDEKNRKQIIRERSKIGEWKRRKITC